MAQLSEEDRKLAIEHRDMLLDVNAVLATVQGKNLFSYLFKYFDVNVLPPVGIPEEMLRDNLGFLRAGNAIFKLAAEADAKIAAELLAKIEKDRYVEAYQNAAIGAR